MIQQVSAWQDDEGGIHASQLDAARANARIGLGKIFSGKNNSTVTQLLLHAQAVRDAIGPLADLMTLEGVPDEESLLAPEPSQPAPSREAITDQPCAHYQRISIGKGRERCLLCRKVLGEVKADA